MEIEKNESVKPTAFLLIMLSALTAFAPFVTDMYLPSLPSMMDYFGATRPEVQLGLTSSMLGLAVGQLIIGPLSDKYGRKYPLIWTLVLFAVSSGLCICASNIEMFVAMRFVQGLGASGGIVLSRSIATDLYRGKHLAAVMAVIGAISGIAPVLSPVIGGFVLNYAVWQTVFVILLVIGIILLISSFRLVESHPKENRQALSILSSFGQIKYLVKNRVFMIYVVMQGAAMFAFFGQIASSPFIFQTLYGFSALAFSGFFAANALAIGIFAFLSAKYRTPQRSVLAGAIMFLISAPLVGLMLFLNAPVFLFEIFLWLMMGSIGLMLAPSTAIAMNSARKYAGLASAVLGAVGFIMGGIASPLAGMGDIRISSGLVFLIGAVVTFIVVMFARKIERQTV